MRTSNERGIALLTTLMVLMLISALLVGFTTVVMSDQRYRFIDRDRGQAFYGAAGAMEKLTADLGNLFYKNVAPTNTQVTALTDNAAKPVIEGLTFTATNAPTPLAASELSTFYCYTAGGTNRALRTVGANGYTVSYCANTANNAPTTTAEPSLIRTGPYVDLIALKAPYQLDVTAKTAAGGEVHLIRTIESVAIPVFQFGIFSDVDLGFNAADDFTFGGRVHTNGNLFLAQAAGTTLTIGDKITAVKQVVRQRLSNGVSIDDSGHTGTVSITKGAGAFTAMQRTWGSVTDGPTSGANEPTWHTTSLTTYNSYIRNGSTGAKALNLPLITVGGSTPDVTRRPPVGEDSTGILFNERLFSKASLRILLSDTAADMTNLPTVTANAVSLETNWNTAPPAGYGAVTSTRPPVALSPGLITATMTNAAGGTINFVSSAAAAPFKPTFLLAGNVITCDRKKTAAPFQLTNCSATPVAAVGSIVTAISPAGGASGASAPLSVATVAGGTVLEFASQAILDRFDPMPFWAGSTLVTCTGYTALTYTGCSSNPAANTVLTSNVHSNAGIGTLGGFIKIDRGNSDGTWTDVTAEILNYGIGGPNVDGTICADPTPNAIIRLQRLRDNGGTACDANNGYHTDNFGAKDPANWWPNVLYDTRESVLRDSNYPGANTLTFNGVMYYVGIDVGNLALWFRGTAPFNGGTGTTSKTDNGGYTVYFSDRRNNRDENSLETGEYGWENHVNPEAVNGAPNASFDTGEDVNANTTQQLYGGHPSYNGVYNTVPPGAPGGSPFVVAATPVATLTHPLARVNRSIFFRRALKLTNGRDLRATGVTGLTVVSENPIYVQGDWNANPLGAGGFGAAHAATAMIGDALTLLSSNWNDVNSLQNPYVAANRPRPANTWYRMAVIAGKSLIFPHPNGTSNTFGTDGGAHAFLHYLEGRPAGGGDTINYRGSLATFYYSRQATGVFKGGGVYVYQIPTNRAFAFDTDFKTPALLPPNTPVFRDMNAVGFSQELRPNR